MTDNRTNEEQAETERDDALARIAELEKSYRIIERLYKIERQERIEAEARIAEAAKLHQPKNGESPRYAPDDYHAEREPVSWEAYTICDYDKTVWPCEHAKILGLNEGENE